MTDNKDLKYTQQFKPYQEIREVRYVEPQDLYPDLGYEDVSSQRGYEPCHDCEGKNKSLKFRLQITLRNCVGSYITGTVYSISEARRAAQEIRDSKGF